jgi:MFS family permease
LAGFLGAALVGQLATRVRRRSSALMIGLLLQVVCAIVLGVMDSFWFASAALILMMAAAGFMMPMRQAYLNSLIPSNKRATVLSFDSLVNNAGASAGSPALGWVDKSLGAQYGYLIGSVLLALGIPMMMRLRAYEDKEDFLQISVETNRSS